ncbi:hypothetical protein SUGI_0714320 [Cryptomeria japonica]|nr:hypothetical protein SUGI_0714320 [Cryptomeria japonica]
MDEEPIVCGNNKCGIQLNERWVSGWIASSGQIVKLCENCSYLYMKRNFCTTFHNGDTGWRNCNSCKEPIHCSCIVSSTFYVFADNGGIQCLNCFNKSKRSCLDKVPEMKSLSSTSNQLRVNLNASFGNKESNSGETPTLAGYTALEANNSETVNITADAENANENALCYGASTSVEKKHDPNSVNWGSMEQNKSKSLTSQTRASQKSDDGPPRNHKNFECSTCRKMFYTRQALGRHKKACPMATRPDKSYLSKF